MDSEITSLKELSLNKIINNFSRYTHAYATTEDETLKRNLHFLQRIYTEYLLEFFTEWYYLYAVDNKSFLNFIFNENLKRLIIGHDLFRFCDAETFLRKAIPIAHNLESILINVSKSQEMEQYIRISKELFPHASNVIKVDIPNICNDEIVKILAFSCPRLKSLDISNSSVTGDGMKTLCLNPDGAIRTTSTLQSLNISRARIKIKDIAFLVKNVPTLEEVKYNNMPAVIEYLYSSDEKDCSKKYNLHVLNFAREGSPYELRDYLTACVEKCPEVKEIKINVSKAEHLELVSLFLKLESLEMRTQKTFLDSEFDLSFNSLLVCIGHGLKYLNVHGLSLSVSVLLENCPNLENLVLNNICYQEFDMNSDNLLRQLHTLEFCSIVFQNLNTVNSVMKLLNSSPILENLTLYCCVFSDSDITSKLLDFSSECNLKYIYFEYTKINKSFLKQLILSCSSLNTLTLECCKYLNPRNISSLRKTVEVSNRKIKILFLPADGCDSASDFQYSNNDSDDNLI